MHQRLHVLPQFQPHLSHPARMLYLSVCAAAAVIAGLLQPWPQELHPVDETR